MSERHASWVDHRQRVRGFFAYPGGEAKTAFTGTVVSYLDSPSVVVETDDGRRVRWAAHLCAPLPEVEKQPCGLCDRRYIRTSGAGELCDEHRTRFDAWIEQEYGDKP